MTTTNTNNTKQAFWVGIGSLCSFGFALISAAILSRFLTKDAYGTYKQVMYVYNTLLVVFTLGLPRAYSYFLPRVNIHEGSSLIKKLNICFVVLGFIFSGVLYLSADLIAKILNNPALTIPMKLFSPTPIFLLPTMGLEGILATYRKTEWNAIYTITSRSLSVIFVVLPVVYYNPNCEVAVAGFAISSVFTCIVGFYFMYLPFKYVKKESSNITYKELFSFTIPLMFAGFWGIAEKSADQFFISRWFGEAIFADFANGSLELPFVGMVLSAGAVVLLPLFSQLAANNSNKFEIINLWQRAAVKAAYILYPLVVYSWFFSDVIMTFLYGEEYKNSGTYFKIMLIVNFFTIAQYYPILLALGKTKLYSKILMFSAIAVWTLEYLIIIWCHNPYAITTVSVIVRICKIFIFLILISKELRCSIKDLLPFITLGKVFISSVLSGLISYGIASISCLYHSNLLMLIIGFSIFSIIELMFAWLFKLPYVDILKPLCLKHKN